MKKIRINELARELEVKAHEILDRLPELGVTEKKTHSSSIDEDVADQAARQLYGHDVPDESGARAETEPAEHDEPRAETAGRRAAAAGAGRRTARARARSRDAGAPPAEETPRRPRSTPPRPAAPIRPPLAGTPDSSAGWRRRARATPRRPRPTPHAAAGSARRRQPRTGRRAAAPAAARRRPR